MHQAVVPPAEVCTDYETLCALAERLGFLRRVLRGPRRRRVGAALLRARRARTCGARAWSCRSTRSSGRPGGSRCRRRRATARSTSRPCAPTPRRAPLPTPSGRIELASATIAGFGYDDCPGHPAWMEPAEWLGSRAREPLPAAPDLQPAVHAPALAVRQRRLQPGLQGQRPRADPAPSGRRPRARHRRGRRRARLQRSRQLPRRRRARRRTCAARWCSSPPAPGGIRSRPATPAALDRHGNPNVLTLDKGTSRLAQGPIAQTALVELERYDGAAARRRRRSCRPS